MRFYIFVDEKTKEVWHLPWSGKEDPIIVECKQKRPNEFKKSMEDKEKEPFKH